MSKQLANARLTQKRPSSPSDCGPKKKANLNTSFGKFNCDVPENVNEIIQKLLARQVELVEQLVFKDVECQKLQRKFDEVDRNFRKWHDFAVSLQARVKRLALILHRQQDSMKNLQNKEIITNDTTEAKPQVSKVSPGLSQSNMSKSTVLKDESGKYSKSYIVKLKQEFQPKSDTSASPSVIIDLTEDEAASSFTNHINKPNSQAAVTPSNVKQNMVKPTLNSGISGNVTSATLVHHTSKKLFMSNNDSKPLAPAQPVGLSTANSNVRQTVQVTTMPSQIGRNALNSDSVINSIKQQQFLLQKNGIRSPLTINCTNGTPYPPLPPMPLPPANLQKLSFPPPYQPLLRINKSKDGIELSWDHPGVSRAKMDSYELYVYQHNPNSSSGNRWKKIGNDSIKAMPLPMACTLSQFSTGSKYYFAVRGKDVHGRYGIFSAPCCSTDVQ
ncbi:uncharacterized protein LOC120326092 isoform X1 [Styela clava]